MSSKIFPPKVFITDIDGVWTDGAVYVDSFGRETKKFTIADGWGARYLNDLGVPWAIVSGEDCDHVRYRAAKLECPHVFVGVQDKYSVIRDLLASLSILPNEAVYIGDDLNDLSVFKLEVPFYCPLNAHPIIKQRASGVLNSKGGHGCFRELVERFFLNEKYLPQYFSSTED